MTVIALVIKLTSSNIKIYSITVNSPKEIDGLTRHRSFFLEISLLVLTMKMKRLDVGVLWPIGLVMLMIGKGAGNRRVNMYVVCDPKNLCELFSPCRNGGSCEPRSNSDRTPGFHCRCAEGFYGQICSHCKYRSPFRTLGASLVTHIENASAQVVPGAHQQTTLCAGLVSAGSLLFLFGFLPSRI